MPSEALLPGTDAIPRGSVEMIPYKRGWLVRYRTPEGYSIQQTFKRPEETEAAHQTFLEYMVRLGVAVHSTSPKS